jgi:hypothetical protein
MKLKLQALNLAGGQSLLVGSSVATELDRLMIAMDLIVKLNGPKNWRPPSCSLALSMSFYNLLWRMPYSAGSMAPKLRPVRIVTISTEIVI